ncbi:MAG TPA: hypothetical protein VN451_10400, partial [Chitinophagaceae bacterium]|nr:hypothetical protein [Chitinophagaceae bacterium]
PPPPPPPQKDMTKIPVEKKCFSNDGLKYKTIVTIYLGDTSVVLGNVMAEELESGKKQTTEFTGTISGEGIIVNFKGEPPVIGTASEWTNNIWTIKKTGRKEILYIIFSAKDYDTNKWKDTDYQFELIDCK